MKRLRPLVAQAANWEPPVPRKHFYAMLLLTAMTLSAVAVLPAPGDILETATASRVAHRHPGYRDQRRQHRF